MVKTGEDKLGLSGDKHGNKHNEYKCFHCNSELDRDDNAVENLIQYKKYYAKLWVWDYKLSGEAVSPSVIEKINITQVIGFLEFQCLNGVYGSQTGNILARVKLCFTWKESSRNSNLNINGVGNKLPPVFLWITYLYYPS